ncbi:hypothetical protein ALC57_09718, partial [Trachymyrmex cornetzi]
LKFYFLQLKKKRKNDSTQIFNLTSVPGFKSLNAACAAKTTSAFLPVTFFSKDPITMVCATTAIKPSTCAPRSL